MRSLGCSGTYLRFPPQVQRKYFLLAIELRRHWTYEFEQNEFATNRKNPEEENQINLRFMHIDIPVLVFEFLRFKWNARSTIVF